MRNTHDDPKRYRAEERGGFGRGAVAPPSRAVPLPQTSHHPANGSNVNGSNGNGARPHERQEGAADYADFRARSPPPRRGTNPQQSSTSQQHAGVAGDRNDERRTRRGGGIDHRRLPAASAATFGSAASASSHAGAPKAARRLLVRNLPKDMSPVELVLTCGASRGFLSGSKTGTHTGAVSLEYAAETDANDAKRAFEAAIGYSLPSATSLAQSTIKRGVTQFVAVRPASADVVFPRLAEVADMFKLPRDAVVGLRRSNGACLCFASDSEAVAAVRWFRSAPPPRPEEFLMLDFISDPAIPPQRSRSPSTNTITSDVGSEGSASAAAVLRRRFNTPTRTVAFRCPDTPFSCAQAREAFATQSQLWPQDLDVVVHGDHVYVTVSTVEAAVEALRRTRGKLAVGPDELPLFFAKAREPLSPSDVLKVSPIAQVTLDAELIDMFSSSIGIVRVDRIQTAFVRFRTVDSAIDASRALAVRHPELAVEFSRQSSTSARGWCVVFRNAHRQQLRSVLDALEPLKGYTGHCTLSVPEFLIKATFDDEGAARRTVTAMTGRHVGGHAVVAEACWYYPAVNPPAPTLRLSEVPLQLPLGTLVAAMREFRCADLRIHGNSGIAHFPSVADAERALRSLSGMMLHGTAPPRYDYASAAQVADDALSAVGMDSPPNAITKPHGAGHDDGERRHGRGDDITSSFRLDGLRSALASATATPIMTATNAPAVAAMVPATSDGAAPAVKQDAPAGSPRGRDGNGDGAAPSVALSSKAAARLYETVCRGQSHLPPGWSYVRRNGHMVLLDHVGRRGYGANHVGGATARFEEQLREGIDRAGMFQEDDSSEATSVAGDAG